jgi:hypothetical protein
LLSQHKQNLTQLFNTVAIIGGSARSYGCSSACLMAVLVQAVIMVQAFGSASFASS